MGFWSGDVNSSFDRIFNMNGDGTLDSIEQGLKFQIIDQMCEEDDERDTCRFNFDELDDMGEEERREALEEAGYDPDDFE